MGIHWWFDLISTCVTFPFLLFMVRWIGKTQISQATYFNWVAGACIGNIGANMLSSENIAGMVSSAFEMLLFSAMTIIFSVIALKSRKFRSITSGIPMILVNHGDLIYDNLRKCKVNKDLLMQMLREQGHFDYKKIKWAILEPTGTLSILPFEEEDREENPNKNQLKEKRQKSQPIK